MKCKLVSVAVVLCSAAAASANLFVNGSLNGPTNTSSLIPSGWSNLAQGTTDTVSAAGHPFGTAGFSGIGSVAYANSVNGGTFVWSADFSRVSAAQPEGLRQTVSGLTVGQQYRIDFEYTNLGLYDTSGQIATAAFGFQNYASNGRWLVDVAGTRVGETSVEAFAQSFGTQVWRTFSVDFTASSTSAEFAFVADWTSGVGMYVGMGIDGLSLTVVPAPGSMAVLGAAVLLMRRRR